MTAADFVAGVPLEYRSGRKQCELIYRVGEGTYLTVDGKEEKLDITTDVEARRVFYNLTGGKR